MHHLNQLLKLPLKATPKWLIWFLIFVAVCGFIDATYLTVDHYTNTNPPCFVGSCELVLTSSYSTFFGISVALFGALYYLFILVLLIIFIQSKKEWALRVALQTTVLGFAFSLYFFILQALVLHAFCQYCLFSAGTSTILFLTAIFIFVKMRKLSLNATQ